MHPPSIFRGSAMVSCSLFAAPAAAPATAAITAAATASCGSCNNY